MSKRYLQVGFSERALAKRHGALWDRTNRCWYYRPGSALDRIYAWRTSAIVTPPQAVRGRTYLNIPSRDVVLARRLGAEWDAQAASFYVLPDTDLATLYRWRLFPTSRPAIAQSVAA